MRALSDELAAKAPAYLHPSAQLKLLHTAPEENGDIRQEWAAKAKHLLVDACKPSTKKGIQEMHFSFSRAEGDSHQPQPARSINYRFCAMSAKLATNSPDECCAQGFHVVGEGLHLGLCRRIAERAVESGA